VSLVVVVSPFARDLRITDPSLRLSEPTTSSTVRLPFVQLVRPRLIVTLTPLSVHTLALTGHQIKSAGNAQSTALDLWDPVRPCLLSRQLYAFS
jgi:hypothetical protein